MINTTVRVKIATDQQRNNPLAWYLKTYLSNQGFDVTDCLLSSSEIKGELEYPNSQWLILALSSELKAENAVKEIGERARELVTQRRLQGVLVITDSPSPDQIARLWPTIRIYDVTQNEDAMNEACNQIYRTLKYTKLPVPVNGSGSQMTHPPQVRTRPVKPLWMRIAPIFVGAALILSAIFGFSVVINHFTPPPPHITYTSTPGHSFTQPASSPSATSDPTAAPNAQTLFNNTTVTGKPASPNYALISTDPPSQQDWQKNAGTCDLKSDGYYITASTPGQYTPCMLQKGTYNDFAFQVHMQISTSGDAGGLIFRSDSKISKFYRFSVDTLGIYLLTVCSHCTDQTSTNGTPLKSGTVSNANQPYVLTVIAIKNTIYLYINKKFVVQVTDSTSSAGAIGLYAASINQNQAATIEFTMAKVWNLPNG